MKKQRTSSRRSVQVIAAITLVASQISMGFTLLSYGQLVEPSVEALETLDARIQGHMETFGTPGVIVAVASRGEIKHLRSYGMANVELDVPVTDSTVFEIGSISKQFVAAAIMLLVEDGLLNLDDPIHKFMPELPSEWIGVTIRQLLTHTSGIPDYEEIRTYDVYRYRLTPEEIIKIAHSRPMDFEPGTGWYYSNTGYFLLSRIVELIEGQPLDAVLKDRIFDPVGMSQTRMADPEAIIRHRASGYWQNRVGDLINRNATETSSTLGAGGLLSSVHDLTKWDAILYGEELLSAESKAKMWEPAVLPDGEVTNYGFGWMIRPYQEMRSQNHSGQVAGFNANFARFPDEGAAVIVLMNKYRVSANYIKVALIHAFFDGVGEFPYD